MFFKPNRLVDAKQKNLTRTHIFVHNTSLWEINPQIWGVGIPAFQLFLIPEVLLQFSSHSTIFCHAELHCYFEKLNLSQGNKKSGWGILHVIRVNWGWIGEGYKTPKNSCRKSSTQPNAQLQCLHKSAVCIALTPNINIAIIVNLSPLDMWD